MSKARHIILSNEKDYQELWKALKWIRGEPQLFEVFIRCRARRDKYQNGHWWAICRNLQWASGGQYTALEWHGWLATHVFGIDFKDLPGGQKGVPWSTQHVDPEEFDQAMRLVEAEARIIYPNFGIAPNEVAL